VKKAILTDIEGTTSSISFVKDVLFPYARRALPAFVAAHAQDPEVRHWLDKVRDELGGNADDAQVVATLQAWIDADRKHTALKALQGMLWRDGYMRGDFRGHVYPDAAAALQIPSPRLWRTARPPSPPPTSSCERQLLRFDRTSCFSSAERRACQR